MFRDFVDRIRRAGPAGSPGRVAGPPTSSNGASSFHLAWELGPPRFREVAATIEVIDPPTAPRLYFWALQASFEHPDGRRAGGAHTGLQHHPAYPEAGAVNWGGYHQGGGELDGSVSTLPSALDNPNTRTYPWVPHRRYRYRIHPTPPGSGRAGWRASITDLSTGAETVIRDLWVGGDALVSPMVWTESFAHCDDPSSAVRWTDLEAVTPDGDTVAVGAVRLNYQTHADGGCANTDTATDGVGYVQRTTTTRRSPVGSRLTLST